MEILKKMILPESAYSNHYIERKVKEIVENIRDVGTDSLKKYNRDIDGYSGKLFVTKEEIHKSLAGLPSDLIQALRVSLDNLRRFHCKQREMFRSIEDSSSEGIIRGMRFVPVKVAGCYIPGGRYPLPSSVLMNVVPAQEAGVERIVLSSPPSGEKGINPVILGTAALAGIDEILIAGGAQAIAALAYGVGELPGCDIITGPGNSFVTEAKRQLAGTVGIDGLAGPSEVLIITDGNSSPELIAMDLMAQAEHDPMSKAVLFSTDRSFALEVLDIIKTIIQRAPTGNIMADSWENRGKVITGTLEEGISFSNDSGPEHLQLCIDKALSLLERFTSYGTAFLNDRTPVPFGDYVAGTNHVLPTSGSARFTGGLWTGTFLRPLSHLELSEKGVKAIAPHGMRIAREEGLWAHSQSINLRL